ncbi:MAG: ERCC4 domain-containing protein [Planctomycetota bacterium]
MPGYANQLTILVDSREQRPWTWTEPGIATRRTALPVGDYSLQGLSDRVAIERKSLDDLVSTLIHHAKRWHAELRRLAAMQAACVIVEAGLPDLLAGRYSGGVHPHAALGRVLSVHVDFGVPVVFAGDRPHARLWATGWLIRTARRLSA